MTLLDAEPSDYPAGFRFSLTTIGACMAGAAATTLKGSFDVHNAKAPAAE